MARQTALEESAGGPDSEEIEWLARQRPEAFPSFWSEAGFLYSVSMSTALTEYFVSGFNVILPKVAEDLHIPQASKTWPANVFSLVVACFLVIFGRFADMYGGYIVYMAGITWFAIWSFIAGWSQNEIMIDVCRALQGFGPAAFLPTGLMLLGSSYRPGPRKNMSMGIYGAMAPIGFYIGIFFGGVTAQYTTWRWWFFIGAVLSLSTLVVAYFSIPSDFHKRNERAVKMDWWGAVLISSGLILVVFAITDSAHAPQRWGIPGHMVIYGYLGGRNHNHE